MYEFFSEFSLKLRNKVLLLHHQNVIELWCNGNTTDSGPVILGSNPGSSTRNPRPFKVAVFRFSLRPHPAHPSAGTISATPPDGRHDNRKTARPAAPICENRTKPLRSCQKQDPFRHVFCDFRLAPNENSRYICNTQNKKNSTVSKTFCVTREASQRQRTDGESPEEDSKDEV